MLGHHPRSYPMLVGVIIIMSLLFPYSSSWATASTGCSTTADFAERDRLPQSRVPYAQWYMKNWNNGWGPRAANYPPVPTPPGCNALVWQQQRIVAVAKKYLGLPYRHHHIPGWNPPPQLTQQPNESAGLDCSNYTAWVYNYGLGISFTSNIHAQSTGPKAPGRLLASTDTLQAGDLLFILRRDRSEVSHVVIFLDEGHIIDSHGVGVSIRDFKGWYKTHFSHARRILN